MMAWSRDIVRCRSSWETLQATGAALALSILTLSFKSISGIKSILAIFSVAGGLAVVILAVLLPVVFIQLPLSWYNEGREVQRSMSISTSHSSHKHHQLHHLDEDDSIPLIGNRAD